MGKIRVNVTYHIPLDLEDGIKVESEGFTLKKDSTLEELVRGVRKKYKKICDNIDSYTRNLSYNGTIYFHNKHKEMKKVILYDGDSVSFFPQIAGG